VRQFGIREVNMRVVAILLALCAIPLAAQQQEPQQQPRPRPLSPDGIASAQVLGEWVKSERETFTMGGDRYQGGRWIDILYGRPLLRGREAFTGTGAEYGKATYAGAPIWRAGANVSTRLRSEVPLIFGTTTVPAGEHTLFIELKSPAEWTLVISRWGASPTFEPKDKQNTIYGAFGYTPDRDIVRVAMNVETLPYRVEELEWEFLDMTADSGRVAIRWDRSMASAPFRVAR
jgi:hypothetical protein